MDGNNKEAIQWAQDLCVSLKQLAQAMGPEIIANIKQNGAEVDENEVHKMAFGFEFKITKMDV
jgi:hypothetical protein